jgi:hypothetical protein
MQHPFAGVIAPAQKPDSQAVDPAVSHPSRRRLFGLIAGALAVGTFGLAASAPEAEATTALTWEEGGRRRRRRVTTLALGEEGSRRPRPTVFWWEDGRRRPRHHHHRRMKK